jgi:hypothetical protein
MGLCAFVISLRISAGLARISIGSQLTTDRQQHGLSSWISSASCLGSTSREMKQRTTHKPEQQQAEQQQPEEPQQGPPTPQELEKLRWRQYRIIGSIIITLVAVFASRFNLITPQFGLGIIIMLYVTQRFTL